jgi:tripartite-type tricarboxylate transporter receptor subunit TctC
MPVSIRSSRRVVGACILAAAAVAALPASAQTAERFPSGPVTIVVPFPAGGSNDVVARIVAQSLSETWKLPLVVENKVGAAGNIGADYVAKAAPNGHTLMLGAVSMVTNPAMYKIPVYVPRVLIPVGVGVSVPLVTVARLDLPAKDVAGLVTLAASRPGGLNAASAGAGTLSHLGAELLEADHKAKINHIPYRGSAPALTDLAGGQVDILVDTVASALPMIQAGKVKAIAVHSPRRHAQLPNVPTYEEQGFKGMSFAAWNMFVVPEGTPADRVAILNAALARVLGDPAVSRSLIDRGIEPFVMTPAASLDFMRGEAQRWEKVIKDKNITP